MEVTWVSSSVLYYKWKTWSACISRVGSLSAVRAALHENADSQPVIWNNLYSMFIQKSRVGEATREGGLPSYKIHFK